MNKHHTAGVIVLAMAMLVALTGVAAAERNIPATPEIQGISTSTSIQAQGTVTETDSLAWTSASNGSSQTAQAIGPPLASQQVQYTTGYNDQYTGVSGQTSFVKSMAVSTGNKIADGSNVAASTSVQFIAIDTGRATRSEDILLDGTGNSTSYWRCHSLSVRILYLIDHSAVLQHRAVGQLVRYYADLDGYESKRQVCRNRLDLPGHPEL